MTVSLLNHPTVFKYIDPFESIIIEPDCQAVNPVDNGSAMITMTHYLLGGATSTTFTKVYDDDVSLVTTIPDSCGLKSFALLALNPPGTPQPDPLSAVYGTVPGVVTFDNPVADPGTISITTTAADVLLIGQHYFHLLIEMVDHIGRTFTKPGFLLIDINCPITAFAYDATTLPTPLPVIPKIPT